MFVGLSFVFSGAMREEPATRPPETSSKSKDLPAVDDDGSDEEVLSSTLRQLMLSRKSPKVDSEAVNKIAGLIRAGTVKRIVVLAGAGISTAAGIPDFRTPGNLPH
jgi:hypothetical protein